MKTMFKEYQKFNGKEYKKLWDNCLFVLDTNVLLNMYRYSRKTVDSYFKVLEDLKAKQQLWIPYQVGFEFFERRIDVISQYERSYDEIISILDKAKKDIEDKYKYHPFLDLEKIRSETNKGLSYVEEQIKSTKATHPKWLDEDDVLEKIKVLFEGNVGNNYDENKLVAIKKEGEERYAKSIPPGFKDNSKSEDARYGDLILWYQIIDKAKETKRAIVFISGDVKEDWWLKKSGKTIMPQPQLKREMRTKANVDFHIYTAENFLELSTSSDNSTHKSMIDEVRRIRELEETRMLMMRDMEKERMSLSMMRENLSMDYIQLIEMSEGLLMEINALDIHPREKEEINHFFRRIRELRNIISHGEINIMSCERFRNYSKNSLYILNQIINSDRINPELSIRLRKYMEKIEYLNQRLNRYL